MSLYSSTLVYSELVKRYLACPWRTRHVGIAYDMGASNWHEVGCAVSHHQASTMGAGLALVVLSPSRLLTPRPCKEQFSGLSHLCRTSAQDIGVTSVEDGHGAAPEELSASCAKFNLQRSISPCSTLRSLRASSLDSPSRRGGA